MTQNEAAATTRGKLTDMLDRLQRENAAAIAAGKPLSLADSQRMGAEGLLRHLLGA